MRTDTEGRVQVLEGILVGGGSAATCREHARTEWGISDRQTRRLVSMARERIRAVREMERSDALAQMLYQLSDLQQAAMAKGDLSTALGTINARARLCMLI